MKQSLDLYVPFDLLLALNKLSGAEPIRVYVNPDLTGKKKSVAFDCWKKSFTNFCFEIVSEPKSEILYFVDGESVTGEMWLEQIDQ